MTLLAAAHLDPKRFFQEGSDPVRQGSSFDLTVGSIYDHEGKKVSGPFILKPNHMVQVTSAELFCIPNDVTGHVTYKTTLTSRGIWALTVGIVDPGWEGPISTTLLNFSRIDHAVSEGDPFLRVSFFEHDRVPDDKLRKAPSLDQYLGGLQKAAATIFPQTFLDTAKIADKAGATAVESMRNRGLWWAAAIAGLFAGIQIITSYAQPSFLFGRSEVSKEEISRLATELDTMKKQIQDLELLRRANTSASAENQQQDQRSTANSNPPQGSSVQIPKVVDPSQPMPKKNDKPE